MYVKILGVYTLAATISFNSLAEEQFRVKPRALGKDLKSYQPQNEDQELLIQEEYSEPKSDIILRQVLSLALRGSVLHSAYPTQNQVKEVL